MRVTTVTHRYADSSDGADQITPVLPDWHGLLGQLERTEIVFRCIQVLDPGPCTRCYPHEPAETGIVLVDYLDRFGNHQRRSCCRGCVLAFLHDAVADATEILVYFTIRALAAAAPAEQPADQLRATSPAVSA